MVNIADMEGEFLDMVGLKIVIGDYEDELTGYLLFKDELQNYCIWL